MFVGHYAVSFAAKRYDPRLPLWLLFLAVQLLDVLWAPFVLLGIEKVRILLALHALVFFGAPPPSAGAAALTALAAYFGFAGIIHFVERASSAWS